MIEEVHTGFGRLTKYGVHVLGAVELREGCLTIEFHDSSAVVGGEGSPRAIEESVLESVPNCGSPVVVEVSVADGIDGGVT